MTNGTRYYLYITATAGGSAYLQFGFGLTAVATQNNTPFTVPAFTVPGLFTPVLSASTVSAMTDTTATLGATVNAGNGVPLGARGTCWGTAAAPTTNCLATGTTGTGASTQARTGITQATRIYYRGYAVNSAATATGYSSDGSFYTKPTTQASGVNFTGVSGTQATVNWTRGSAGANGGVLVVMKQGSAVTSTPTDGVYNNYNNNQNTVFGSGFPLGTGEYVVYMGTGTSVTVTGLTAGTYHVAVFEYAGAADTTGADYGTNYKLSPATGNVMTADVDPPAGLALSSPADYATDQPLSMTLQSTTATDASGPVSYYFELSDDSVFTTVLQNSGWQLGTSWSPATLTEGVTYFWRAKAKDSAPTPNEGNWTTPRSFTTYAPCQRNNPSLSLKTGWPTGDTVGTINTNNGAKVYVLEFKNNDYGSCGNTTFNLSVSDNDPGSNFDAPQLSASSVTLSSNQTSTTVTVTVTATDGKTAGQSWTKVTSAADANHASIMSNNVITTINVPVCTIKTPYLIIGPDTGYVAVGGNISYTITLQNNDTGADCTATTFTLGIVSESSTTHFTLPSTLSATTKTLNPGQRSSLTLTVAATATAANGQTNMTTIGASAPGHSSPSNINAVTTVGNPMLHNSKILNSTKWAGSGGWGIPGGRYGEIVCTTCHVTTTTTNIKKIVTSMVTPTTAAGTFPGHNQPVVFTRTSGTFADSGLFGNDRDTVPSGRSSSNRICEVCHTYDATKANGVNTHPYSSGAATLANHNGSDAMDCTTCHKHNKGFAGPACNSCHGDPPVANTLGGPNGLATSFATGATITGKHQTHAVVLSYDCNTCHNGYSSGKMPQESTVKPGFGDITISFNTVGGTTGTYSGQSNVSYNNGLGTGTKTCSNVYCHSSGQSADGASATPVYQSPTWDGTTVCGNCHSVTGPNISTGSHPKHLALNTNCGNCHTGASAAAYNSTNHINNLIDVANGYSSGGARGNGYGTCTSASCHASAYVVGGFVTTPTWSTAGGCGTCHPVNGTTGAPATGAHDSHLNNTNAVCGNCHNGAVKDSNGGTAHLDGDIDVSAFSYPANVTKHASGAGYSTCSAVACHGGKNPAWGQIGAWDCKTCHDASFTKTLGGGGSIRNVTGTGGDFTKASRHLRGTSTVLKWDCIVCHMEGQYTGAGAGHVDKTYHNEGSGATGGKVNLRDVDNPASGWAIDNRAWGTTDYTNLDMFCLNCHDANGASGIAVNNSNNGLLTGAAPGTTNRTATGNPNPKASLMPFNTTDIGANGEVSGSTTNANFNRWGVLNLKDKFFAGNSGQSAGWGPAYTGNPSQHAVIARRYSTIWKSWSVNAWGSTYVLKKTGVKINVSRDTSLLTCADCHVIDKGANGNAHGAASPYMLWSTFGADGTGWTAATVGGQEFGCWKCHNPAVYKAANGATVIAGSRIDHANIDGGQGGTYTAYGLAGSMASGVDSSWPCLQCHANWNGFSTVTRNASYGGIHGSWQTTASWFSTTAGPRTAYRFAPGTNFKISPASDTAWGSGGTISCYFYAPGESFSTCTRHGATSSGSAGTAVYGRQPKY